MPTYTEGEGELPTGELPTGRAASRDRAHAERRGFVDYLGNLVPVLHYEFAGRGVREWPDGSMLLEVAPAAGRWRSLGADHVWARAIRSGSELLAGIAQVEAKMDAIRSAPGTHEPVTYYRDREGRVGVPPEPGLPPPDDVTVHTLNTLAEADALSREMKEQMYREFQDDGVATAYWDNVFGYERQEVLRAISDAPTAKGREIARLLLADLDREAADRQRITTEAHFHYRDYDR